jgi:two-component system, NarL family, response regulator LiaR
LDRITKTAGIPVDHKSNVSILVADDHPAFRDGFCRLLEDEPDFKVIGRAGNCEEVVRLASQLHPDVAIIDVSMPGMAGIEAVKQIKEASPTTAILMLSAYDYESFVLAALRAGANGYLLKNSPCEELLGAIRRVHLGKVVLDPEIASVALQRLSRKKGTRSDQIEELSRRELEVLALVARGCSNKKISEQLVISERTVDSHLIKVFGKLGVKSRTTAVLSALKKGWLTSDSLP